MRQGQGQEQAGDAWAPAYHRVAGGQQPHQQEEATDSGKDKSEQLLRCGCEAGSEHGIGLQPGLHSPAPDIQGQRRNQSEGRLPRSLLRSLPSQTPVDRGCPWHA